MTTKLNNAKVAGAILAVSLLALPALAQQTQQPAAQNHDSMAGMDMSGAQHGVRE